VRLNITVSDEVNKKLDSMASRWGVSKSGLCAMILGKYVDGIDKAYDLIDKYGADLIRGNAGKDVM
jgi:predicted transcriptional regulator